MFRPCKLYLQHKIKDFGYKVLFNSILEVISVLLYFYAFFIGINIKYDYMEYIVLQPNDHCDYNKLGMS